jgi:peptidoglycan/xylan/chitin deacetylase (PgdA/CDA1 family)
MATAAGGMLFRSGLHRLLLGADSVVVAFHRVNDGHRDELTLGVEAFEAYCLFFARHFRVVSLGELLDGLEPGASAGRLAITFDDGYRDNWEHAAPVLLRLGLPGTFFVVSGWMGTDQVAWWDEQLREPPGWMSWDQVRSLHRNGFEIGAHTRTHVDLGRVSGNEAREEIEGGRADLERELGTPTKLFAYPYGRRDNLTAENRERVRAAGFRCCASAFGGRNPAGSDPFQLRRIPISGWYTGPSHLGVNIAIGRT